jgi:hypothetical protein
MAELTAKDSFCYSMSAKSSKYLHIESIRACGPGMVGRFSMVELSKTCVSTYEEEGGIIHVHIEYCLKKKSRDES